jgi:hypothetical protein
MIQDARLRVPKHTRPRNRDAPESWTLWDSSVDGGEATRNDLLCGCCFAWAVAGVS